MRGLYTAVKDSTTLMQHVLLARRYGVYNNLAYVSLSHFDPPSYFILLQLRIIVTGPYQTCSKVLSALTHHPPPPRPLLMLGEIPTMRICTQQILHGAGRLLRLPDSIVPSAVDTPLPRQCRVATTARGPTRSAFQCNMQHVVARRRVLT